MNTITATEYQTVIAKLAEELAVKIGVNYLPEDAYLCQSSIAPLEAARRVLPTDTFPQVAAEILDQIRRSARDVGLTTFKAAGTED